MGKMGYGYGSEFHLLRWMGRHRERLNEMIKVQTGLKIDRWLDFEFDAGSEIPDSELKGLQFIQDDEKRRLVEADYCGDEIGWAKGSMARHMNWDAVAVTKDGALVLCEAKAHVEEIQQDCKAEGSNLKRIARALEFAKNYIDAEKSADWLHGHYQQANRLYVQALLAKNGIRAWQLNIYFTGDGFPRGQYDCPKLPEGWRDAIEGQSEALGLDANNEFIKGHVREVFLPVSGEAYPTNVDPASHGKLVKDLALFLDRKGYEIALPESVRQETHLSYRFAKQIFKNKDVLIPFMCRIALEVGSGKPIKYRAGSSVAENILKNFLQGLTASGHAVSRMVEGDEIEVTIPSDEKKRRFFRSDWAEECFRYVISKTVSEFCKAHMFSYRIMLNVKLKKKGDDRLFTELDVVVQICGRFYSFEVKSGPWVRIMQWAARELAFVDKDGYFRNIVCTIHDDIPSRIFEPQTLMSLNDLEQRLSAILSSDFKVG